MTDLERLALAALVHDLPALFDRTGVQPSESAQRVLAFARLDDPVLAEILDQAESYAMSSEGDGELVTDQALISIFSRIQLNAPQEPELAFHQFAPLPSTDESPAKLFPVANSNTAGLEAHVGELAEELSWLGSSVDLSRFSRVYPHLLAVLQRYGWCLPGHSQDVALFDHAKLTSAIAAALYRYHEDELAVDTVREGADGERFCLLVGDLSGIQDYIFGITTIGPGGVARRLRARSFYLSVLSDVISHQITRRFDVPLGNVIMSSGGKFYVLIPNLGQLDNQIHALRREIDSWLREAFNGEIAINLAHVCFAGNLFQRSSRHQRGFGDVLTDLSFKLNREKRRRGQSVLTDDSGWDEEAFTIEWHFGGVGACVSCGKFPGDRRDNLCAQCERDVQIGRDLPRARYVAYYEEHQADEASMPMPFDCSVRVLAEDGLAGADNPYLITKLNDPEIRELADYAGSFRYLANHVPADNTGAHRTFEEIACKADGRNLLGYVKADVDYLGILFAQGLRRDVGGYDTAAHIAALSRELDLFFSGWVQHLLSRQYGWFYTIFSGGDDLFLVGPWDKAAKLALDVHDQFAVFVAGNPDITLSAGILFTKERYPISRAAEDAEDELEKSKERKWEDETDPERKRNQFTILDDTFLWEVAPDIFAEIETLQERSGQMTSAFLYNLVEYGRLYRLWKDERKIEGLHYKPLFAYNIARNLRKGDSELYRWADALMQSLHSDDDNLTMKHLGLIATYLLFTRRNG